MVHTEGNSIRVLLRNFDTRDSATANFYIPIGDTLCALFAEGRLPHIRHQRLRSKISSDRPSGPDIAFRHMPDYIIREGAARLEGTRKK